MSAEKKSARRLPGQTSAELNTCESITPPPKSNVSLGHCARCGCRVCERNFGSARQGRILLLWCADCHAANQQPTLEVMAVRP